MGTTILEQIAEHEGFRSFVYDDASGRRLSTGSVVHGTATFGIGFTSITEQESRTLLENRIVEHFNELRKQFEWFDGLSDNRQRVLMDMRFNLGMPRLLGFVDMLKALEQGFWIGAAAAMRNSRWFEQVGARAETLTMMMRWDVPFEEARRMAAVKAARGGEA